jgi:hypothetical protein
MRLGIGDPGQEVTIAWQCYQQLRSIYHVPQDKGRALVAEVLTAFPSCPISDPEAGEECYLGLLRHQRRIQRTHRSYQRASSKTPAE